MNGIAQLLSTDGFIQVNKALIKKLGLHEAIMVGELCAEYNYWESMNKLTDDGMFYSTRENIEENTGLSEHHQRKAISTLKELGILDILKKGLPAVNYYKIHFEVLLSILETSSASNRRQLDDESVDINNNKQTNIKEENKVLSKDNTTDFQFGSKKLTTKKESLYTKCVHLIDAKIDGKSDSQKTRALLIQWLNMLLEKYKDKGRPLYVNVFKGKLNMLDKYDDADWDEIIEFNIQRGYEGFYPIPTSNNYDVRKGKAWEEGISCETYTDEFAHLFERRGQRDNGE